jgi:hypothetical protein
VAHLTFSLPDGSLIFLEEDPAAVPTGPQPAGRLEDTVLSLESALLSIRKGLGSLISSMRSALPTEPDELEIEFGLKGALEVNGFLVAKATSDAHYKVKMTWRRTTPGT